jgi:hypothetical protein
MKAKKIILKLAFIAAGVAVYFVFSPFFGYLTLMVSNMVSSQVIDKL